MSKENVLSAMKITDFLFDKGVIKNAPGLAAKDEEINFNGLSAEELGEIFGYLKELKKTENSLEIPMPFALKIRIAKKLVQDMAPERGTISIGHILQGLSFQMNSSYRQIYELLGLNETEAKQINDLFVFEPSEEVITGAKIPLLKIIRALRLDPLAAERIIFWSFAYAYPDQISLKSTDDPDYESDKVDPRVSAVFKKVFDNIKDGIDSQNVKEYLDNLPVSMEEVKKFIELLESAEETDIPMPQSLVEALAK